MPYFRVLTPQLAAINALLHKEERWLILINADPDAIGSALALQRILRKKTKLVHIARINTISRPDNLAMIRNLRIPIKAYSPEMLDHYDKFALVDSQPHHNPIFTPIDFSIVIDHHPLPKVTTEASSNSDDQDCNEPTNHTNKQKKVCLQEPHVSTAIGESRCPCKKVKNINTLFKNKLFEDTPLQAQPSKHCTAKNLASHKINNELENKIQHSVNQEPITALSPMFDIRPDYGATCTMLTEYLYHARIRPGKCLATALQYGIRTDTGMFGRLSTEVDLRAYHYLSRFADQNMLMRIIRSEYLPQWLPYFTRAFDYFKPCGIGHFTYLSQVDSPDILVVIADFFLRVHGLKYIVVAGIYEKRIICIFRGTDVNLGQLAQNAFSEYGSAGGHSAMARAEIPLSNLKKIKKELSCNLRKKTLSPEENKEIEEFLLARLKQFGTRKKLLENQNITS